MFKDPLTHKTLWEQEIPEAAFVKKIDRHGGVDPIEKRWSMSCKVQQDGDWGWVLVCTMMHAEAEQIWSFVMNDVDFTKLQHYDDEKKEYPSQTRYSIFNGGRRTE